MNQTERMKIRLKSIYYYLKEKGNPVHSSELVEEFGYGTRTIQRDLRTLESNHLVRTNGKGMWVII